MKIVWRVLLLLLVVALVAGGIVGWTKYQQVRAEYDAYRELIQPGARVAGVEVGWLTPEEARAKVWTWVAEPYYRDFTPALPGRDADPVARRRPGLSASRWTRWWPRRWRPATSTTTGRVSSCGSRRTRPFSSTWTCRCEMDLDESARDPLPGGRGRDLRHRRRRADD